MAMAFSDAVGEGIFNYCYVNQRAARAEYWWWILFAYICMTVAVILDSIAFAGWHGPRSALGPIVLGGPFFIVIGLALFLPTLTVTIRRLHDTNKSGWWLLFPYGTAAIFIYLFYGSFNALLGIGTAAVGGRSVTSSLLTFGISANLFIAFGILLGIFSIILFIFMLLPSNPGNNKYGPNRYAGSF